ncbi:MAG: chloride channel protein [Acidimicrobiales bacterium]
MRAWLRPFLAIDPSRQLQLLTSLVRWIALGLVVGVLAGASSAALLESLTWATKTQVDNGWLLWLLPVAGLLIGLTYQRGAGESARGNNLILDEIHAPDAWVPRRMAPLVLVATVITHLFGGSAGREGTALQMSGSLTDNAISRFSFITGNDRRILLIAALSGGFGAVFGVPFAGFIFGLEVQSVGRIRHDAVVPALTASVTGDWLVRRLGVEHTPVPLIGAVELTASLVAKMIVAGICFAVAAVVFSELTHGIKAFMATTVPAAPLRPVIGGIAVIGLTFLSGSRDYAGLSIPLITESLSGVAAVAFFAFAWKLLFTAVTLGSGFQGGEVTPLFVVGVTLGATLGDVLHAPIPLFAAMGFVAVFAGATNTPLACTVMGVEMFGAAIVVPLAIGCVISYVLSSGHGIYGGQRRASSLPEPARPRSRQ